MLRLKPGVKLADISPRMSLAAQIVDTQYEAAEVLECWITSANDSVHGTKSRHYPRNTETKQCEALDFRLHNVPTDRRPALVNNIENALGPEFDVVWEAAGMQNEHLHVEWDAATTPP